MLSDFVEVLTLILYRALVIFGLIKYVWNIDLYRSVLFRMHALGFTIVVVGLL